MLNFETLNAIWYNGDISYGIIRCQNILAKKKKTSGHIKKTNKITWGCSSSTSGDVVVMMGFNIIWYPKWCSWSAWLYPLVIPTAPPKQDGSHLPKSWVYPGVGIEDGHFTKKGHKNKEFLWTCGILNSIYSRIFMYLYIYMCMYV